MNFIVLICPKGINTIQMFYVLAIEPPVPYRLHFNFFLNFLVEYHIFSNSDFLNLYFNTTTSVIYANENINLLEQISSS